MGYDRERHDRRSIRMRGYDYTWPGFYFVTICAQDGRCVFGKVEAGDVALDEVGRMVEEVWGELPGRYRGVDVDAFVVMPNHVHGIVILGDVGAGPRACPGTGQPGAVAPTGAGPPQGGAPTLLLGDVLHRFKSLTTARHRRGVLERGWVRFPGRLWQRNYWERVIRDEEELNRTREYVRDNPLKWEFDRENPERVADAQYEREWGWLHGNVGRGPPACPEGG